MKLDDVTVAGLLTSVAARTPTPGGGAVASLTAALGAALGRMVVGYSTGRASLAEHRDLHEEAGEALDALRHDALALAEADAAAYGRLNALWKLPADDERRRRDLPEAVRGAIDAPVRVIDTSLRILALLDRLCGRTNPHLASDLAVAAILAGAAARAAAWNVRVNLPALDDAAEAARVETDVGERLERAAGLEAAIDAASRLPA